ncbi:git-1 [Pristionchus pacificus]|uniref:Git-1 n=1 Tax=Pristionchus pacificus TaxID=54126 RepID=A0A2A6CU13_PRIPA|nr:git-1 [Pristionchus pacificus]|eukprot:PDM81608.1 git-1 [Pristionchus pacificus]
MRRRLLGYIGDNGDGSREEDGSTECRREHRRKPLYVVNRVGTVIECYRMTAAHSITPREGACSSRSLAPLRLAPLQMQGSLSEPPPQCADCGTEDPSWASLNRGVLVCTDCCFVHRNLGRYISQIKSLKKSHWDSGQLELIKLLHRSGSNRIWEHALTQPQFLTSVKKPIPSDPVFPTKETFIKAKYVDQAYTIRQGKDDDPVNVEDLNRQLWSCVRAPHVDTTLRLLVLGADANYYDPEKHNTPLHVAAKEGQLLQVELLFIYGACPTATNLAGQTPSQVAKSEGHYELGNRLTELCFDITNKLSWYLSGKKPEHQKNQHFLIPDLVGKGRDELKPVRLSLQQLPNDRFESLAEDVYDEVERRENVAAWESSREKEAKHLAIKPCVACDAQPTATEIGQIPATHLGIKLEIEETDGEDKKMFASTNEFNRTFNSSRDYDEVAEYRARSSGGRGSSQVGTNGLVRASMGSLKSGELLDKDLSRLPSDDVLELRERLSDCEGAIQMLMSTNNTLNKKIHSMQTSIDRNSADYRDLQHEYMRLNEAMNNVNMAKRMPSPAIPSSSVMSASTVSMNNNSERKMSRPSILETSLDNNNRFPRRGGGGMVTSPTPMMKNLPPSGRMSVDHVREREEERLQIHPMTVMLNNSLRIDQVFTDAGFPDNLIRETECLTTAIRQLLSDAQKGLLASVAEKHAYNIGSLISHIIELIPSDLHSQSITDTVDALASATALLSAKCNSPQLDSEETCHAAYNVAKAAKSLLVAVHD